MYSPVPPLEASFLSNGKAGGFATANRAASKTAQMFALLLLTYKPTSSSPLTERKGRGLSTSLEQQRILQWQLNGVRDFFCINSNLPMSSHRTLGRDNNKSRRFDLSPFREDSVNDCVILRLGSKDCSTPTGDGGLH